MYKGIANTLEGEHISEINQKNLTKLKEIVSKNYFSTYKEEYGKLGLNDVTEINIKFTNNTLVHLIHHGRIFNPVPIQLEELEEYLDFLGDEIINKLSKYFYFCKI